MPRGRKPEPGPLAIAVAAVLSDAFTELLMTQRRLASLTGMSQSAISQFLRGDRTPDIDQLASMCRELGLTVSNVIAVAEATLRSEA